MSCKLAHADGAPAGVERDRLGFLPRLEALRGIAAVAVVGYHAHNDEVVTGMAPVVLFFVLSGFVLAAPWNATLLR